MIMMMMDQSLWILDNELADKAAKSACLQAMTLPPYLFMKAAKSFILQGIKEIGRSGSKRTC